jgi:hypothetical protein
MKELFFPFIVSMLALNRIAKERPPSKTSYDLAEEFMTNVLGVEVGEFNNSIGVVISPKTLETLKDSARIGFELSNIISGSGELVGSSSSIPPPPEILSDITWKEFLDNTAQALQNTLPIMKPNMFLHLFTDAAVAFGTKEWSISQAGYIFIYCSLGLSLSVALAARELERLKEEEDPNYKF